jgi:hypothetical protein
VCSRTGVHVDMRARRVCPAASCPSGCGTAAVPCLPLSFLKAPLEGVGRNDQQDELSACTPCLG